MSHVGALTRCRYPHRVILSIDNAITGMHILLDARAVTPETGEPYGEIVQSTLDKIEEVIENASKTTKVLAKKAPEADGLDPYSDGPGFGSPWGSGVG